MNRKYSFFVPCAALSGGSLGIVAQSNDIHFSMLLGVSLFLALNAIFFAINPVVK